MTAIVLLGPGALDTARRVAGALPGAALHGAAARFPADAPLDRRFADAATHIRALFADGVPIVGLCAAGILIRALAPLLADKRAEPPVLAVAADGSAVVPLLGGHRGANALAARIATALDAPTAITTASDGALGVALDDPPPGWRVGDPARAKAVAAALLAGDPVALVAEGPAPDWLPPLPAGAARAVIRATPRRPAPGDDALVLHPTVVAVGVGASRGADPAEAVALVDAALAAHDLAPGSVACVATLDLKEDEPALHAVAAHLGAPLRLFDAAALEAETPRLATPSETVFRAVGCHGVAEAAALAAAGRDASLVAPKRKTGTATCALALSPAVIDPARAGRAPGHLAIVGLGPGAPGWRTPEALDALAAAEDVVGYHLYLETLPPLPARRHGYPLGAEAERARAALDLAASGRRVALVSSGDAGIYAMASLAFELIDHGGRPDWARLAVAVVPGVSALQAAAARAGAPLGHDFCTISLSDLLTPWPMIERRLEAAAAGDFVVALYNPISARRRHQLPRAREILLTARPADTPVVVAKDLGHAGERVAVVRLADLDPASCDMRTVLLVGATTTRAIAGGRTRVYTPRGYAVGGG